MKNFLLTLLAVIVIFGALAGTGYAGYRMGYANGATGSGDAPAFGFYHMNPNRMPMHRFDNDFGPGMMPYGGSRMMPYGGAPMMGRGGFGFFSLFHFIWNLAVLGLVIWFVYWLFTKSGWRIVKQNGQDISSKTE